MTLKKYTTKSGLYVEFREFVKTQSVSFNLSCVFEVLIIVNCWQVMYFLLHMEKGTPFETADQGKFRYSTVWEQLDYGVQLSASRKFLTIVPVVL